ncbi:MAG: hypothetical protein SPJ18_01085 [Bacilli bacterium]|nr:hypothetical protein [Bacilli bacterium]MDY5455229.1 hypothetical protein [Bacilli bacterium]MDY6008484.1 hypothetical protein [Bacilli bacterium]
MNSVLLLLLPGLTVNSMQSVNLKKDSYEIIEMRTEHQKVFKLSNGNYKYQIYSNPIHYFDGERMVELDDRKDSISRRTYKKTEKIEKEKIEKSRKKEVVSTNNSYSDVVKEKNEVNRAFNGADRYSQINNEYLITDDENYIFPINQVLNYSEDGSEYYTSEYDADVLLSDEVSYPLTRVNESIVLDRDSTIIRDKYVTLGVNGSTESSVLLAGTDQLQIGNPMNGSLSSASYVTVVELDFPDINHDYLVSASFGISKSTTTTSSNRNPTITLNKVTSGNTYDSFSGTTSYTKTRIATGLSTLTDYSFDISDYALDCINNGSKLLLTVEGSSSSYASFYSTESSNSSCPYVSIEVTENVLGATPYGDAPAYTQVGIGGPNCFGYVLQKSYEIGIDLGYGNYSYVYNSIKDAVEARDYSIREISSYNSDIYSDERRIAFRYNTLPQSWHFVMQHCDGSWSGKAGKDGQSGQYAINITPNEIDMWSMYSELHNKTTHYYAIREI